MKTIIILVSLLFVIAPAANAGSGDVKSTNILKLSCSMGEKNFIVNVDLISCTANGFPANINEDTISWSRDNIRRTINRYTGEIATKIDGPAPKNYGELRAVMEFESQNSGKCHRVSEKQF